MRKAMLVGLMWAGVATAGSAQLVGGGLGAGVGASMGSTIGGVGANTGAAAGVGAGGTVSDVTRATRGATRDAADATQGAADATSRAAAQRTPSIVGGGGNARIVRVRAGARVRATRETRCYDGASYWDPYYGPDGYYYCETRGPGASAGVGVKAGG